MLVWEKTNYPESFVIPTFAKVEKMSCFPYMQLLSFFFKVIYLIKKKKKVAGKVETVIYQLVTEIKFLFAKYERYKRGNYQYCWYLATSIRVSMEEDKKKSPLAKGITIMNKL